MLINLFFSLIFYYRGPESNGWSEYFPSFTLVSSFAPKPWLGVHPAVLGAVVCSSKLALFEAISPPHFWIIKVQILLQERTNQYLRFSTGSETVGSQLGKDGESFSARKVAASWLDGEKPPRYII